MTDLTFTVSSLLKEKHNCDPVRKPISPRMLDSFLIEARQINRSLRELISYLRAIRVPYLSTAPPPRRNQKHARVNSKTHDDIPAYLTDKQREDIDSQTAALLIRLNSTYQNLEQANNLRHENTQRRLERKYGKSTNFLLRWAAGGDEEIAGDAGKPERQKAEEVEERDIYQHRLGVLYYLKAVSLRAAVNARQDMVDKRLEREREKAESTLSDVRNRNVKLQLAFDFDDDLANTTIDTRGRDTYNPALSPDGDSGGQELTKEQLQLFEQENSSLMNHYNETLTQVTQAEKSLLEISSLQQTLVSQLSEQGELISNLVIDADRTDENVQRGNKELKRATERTRWPRYMYHVTLYLCAGLVVWDLIF
ncbi:syntaxin ufe1 [Lithohypha guttulata]|uniref:syntaxin ufe1 n=1 Tax=Lithohypha guttulata TaxID=1690604 RepID=UPI002DE10642|nr:syntaxin ufe1 [Lithohypha guttulata]